AAGRPAAQWRNPRVWAPAAGRFLHSARKLAAVEMTKCRTAKRAALSTPDPGSPAANRATWLLQKPMVNAVSFMLSIRELAHQRVAKRVQIAGLAACYQALIDDDFFVDP